jgi:nitric oxide reductase subunit C
MTDRPWWGREHAWRKIAALVTGASFVILVVLTFDTHSKTVPGRQIVPAYEVINQRVTYALDPERNVFAPLIAEEDELLFGRRFSAAEAEALVTRGKKVIQGRNCMNCHTLLGNGAYYAPDLTKAWLDPAWGSTEARETLMLSFLLNPELNARTYGSGRRMPNLDLDEEEARAVMAFLKWMSAIDTNGFPHNFPALTGQEG